MGWIGCARCEKFLCNFVAQTFALIAPIQLILHRVYYRNNNIPKGTKTLRIAPKHDVTVQWGGSGALVAKNYDVTSWQELLH